MSHASGPATAQHAESAANENQNAAEQAAQSRSQQADSSPEFKTLDQVWQSYTQYGSGLSTWGPTVLKKYQDEMNKFQVDQLPDLFEYHAIKNGFSFKTSEDDEENNKETLISSLTQEGTNSLIWDDTKWEDKLGSSIEFDDIKFDDNLDKDCALTEDEINDIYLNEAKSFIKDQGSNQNEKLKAAVYELINADGKRDINAAREMLKKESKSIVELSKKIKAEQIKKRKKKKIKKIVQEIKENLKEKVESLKKNSYEKYFSKSINEPLSFLNQSVDCFVALCTGPVALLGHLLGLSLRVCKANSVSYSSDYAQKVNKVKFQQGIQKEIEKEQELSSKIEADPASVNSNELSKIASRIERLDKLKLSLDSKQLK